MFLQSVSALYATHLRVHLDAYEQLGKTNDPNLRSLLAQKNREVEREYAHAVRFWKSGISYLIVSYTRRLRYYKIWQMFEKVPLLVVVYFFISANHLNSFLQVCFSCIHTAVHSCKQVIVGGGIVFVYFVVAVITWAHFDILEDVMDISCRLANTVTALIIILLNLVLNAIGSDMIF